MALQSTPNSEGIQYDSDLFSPADIGALLELDTEGLPALQTLLDAAPSVALDERGEADSEPESVEERDVDHALEQAVELLRQDPEFADVLDSDFIAEVKTRLVSTLIDHEVDESVAQGNKELRESVTLQEQGSLLALCVDDQPILTAQRGVGAGDQMALVMATAWVVLDIVFVVAAVVNVALARSQAWAKRVAESVKSMRARMVGFVEQYIRRIRTLLPAFRSGRGESRTVVRNAKAIASAIGRALSWANEHKVIPMLKKIFVDMIAASTLKDRLLAIASLVGGLLAAAATFGSTIVFTLVNLAAQLVFLVVDSIHLAEALDTRQARAT